jgi:ubiquinone/menaquinone biosynthesis C-methylase UbiE
MNPTTANVEVDFDAIKSRQQAAWASGDYGQVGTRLQIVGEAICEAVDLLATERVLDVAAGNGNASLAAARRFADVTSTDRVQALLDEGKRRSEAEQLPMKFQLADAEALPFPDRSFDVVLSTFGVMFAPDQERAAQELLRVTREGGRIGLANGTPDGFVGRMFDVVRRFAPLPPGVRSPMEWGTETRLVELFGPDASDIRTQRKTYNFRYRSAEHWVTFFRTYYGPVLKAFASLDEAGQEAMHAALLDLVGRGRGSDWPVVIPSDYLEVVITR